MNVIEYESLHEDKSFFEEFCYNTYPCSIPLDFEQVPLHWHDEVEFIYIKKGQGIVSVELEEYVVKADDIVMILPGQIHGIFKNGMKTMEYENIIFDAVMLSSTTESSFDRFIKPFLNNEMSHPVIFRNMVAGYESIKRHLDSCDNICTYFPSGYELLIKANILEAFFDIITIYGEKKANSSTNNIDKLKSVIKYVEMNYQQRISIDDVAFVAGFSESYFMRFFKETMGQSFVTFLNDYRLTMASRLLLLTEDNILVVAEEVGFDNLSHFNRCFKKKYGMTPREYRRSE